MRRFKWAAPAAIMLALAGCGGTRTVFVPTPTSAIQVQQATAPSRCATDNTAIDCNLPAPPPQTLSIGLFRAAIDSTVARQGVDFAWTKVPASQAGSFGASYLSFDPSKNWNVPLINSYHAAHKGTVAVFETGATRATQGCAAGAADARTGEALLARWGYPRSHEDMAIDFDATGPQIAAYFRCANQAEPGLVGAYGGYRPLQYLCANHITTLNWQTYAWSGGLWLPASCAPLEQYLNGTTFDHDRAIASNYGQFPSPAPPGPSTSTVDHWRTARNSSFTQYHGRHCTLGTDKRASCDVFASRVLYFQGKLWTTVPKWSCWGKRARSKTLVCWIVRPEVSHWSKAHAASQKAYFVNGCDGPVSFPRPVHSKVCNMLRQRQNYFAAKVRGAFKVYARP